MRLIILFFVLSGLSGCAHQDVAEVGSHLTETYTFPNTYSEHRAQQQYFISNGGKIAYTDHGTGDTLILLHGVPTSSWLYRKIIPQLQQHMRVISIDLLGYGSSDKPKDNPTLYSPQNQAVYIQSLLAHLDIDSYGIMMHDMGGLVAWELLRNQPSKVSRLVIQNTIIREKGFEHPNIPPGMIARQITQAYSNRLTSSAILETSLQSLGLGGDYKLSEAECFGYVKPMIEGSSDALYAFFSNINSDLYAQLESNKNLFERFSGDTLVLWGGQDTILTTEQIPFLQEHLKLVDSSIHVYNDHKHFLVEEIPNKIANEVIKFVARTEK
jgi:haloalkane dehalogenase